MIHIKKLAVRFGEKLLIKDSELTIYDGKLHVLKGPSGTGKTTVIKSLLLENNFAKSYSLNNIRVDLLSDKDKENVISSYFGVMSQSPSFINELKLYEHIEFLKRICNTHYDESQLLKDLDISHLLNKYPQQLSGGEKTKFSLLFSLIKSPSILLLDEPTAQLDLENSMRIIKTIKSIVAKGITVFATTHDSRLIDEADIVMAIEDKKIQTKRNDMNIKTSVKCEIHHRSNCKMFKLFKYFRMMQVRNTLTNKVVNLLTVVAISLLSFSTIFNNLIYSVQSEQTNKLASNELLVYKPLAGNMEYSLDPSSRYEPITEEEVKEIKSISHVSSVEWNILLDNNNPNNFKIEDKRFGTYNDYEFHINNGSHIKNLQEEDVLCLSLYYNDINYDKKIDKSFNQDGIYISEKLYKNIFSAFNENEVKNTELEFSIFVPQYLSWGKTETYLDNGDIYKSFGLSCERITIKTKIAGILNGRSMSSFDDGFNYHIYIDQNLMEDYIKENEPRTGRKIYLYNTESLDFTIDELPEDRKEDVGKIWDEQVWKPQLYSVFTDNITYIDDVKKELNNMGLKVESEYVNTELLLRSIQSIQSLLKTILISISAFIIFAYIVFKYINRKNDHEFTRFLISNGISTGLVKRILVQKYTFCYIRTIIYSTSILLILVVLTNFLKLGVTTFSWLNILVIITLAFLIEMIFPYVIEKVTK